MLILSVSPSSTGQKLNASFVQGDVVAWSFTGSINGAPINLTGATIKMTIGMSSPIVLSTGNGGIIITNALLGQFQVNITSTQSAAYTVGQYNYDLWIESQVSPPIETQYISGIVSVIQSITAVP